MMIHSALVLHIVPAGLMFGAERSKEEEEMRRRRRGGEGGVVKTTGEVTHLSLVMRNRRQEF